MRSVLLALTVLAASAAGAFAESPAATAQPESWRYVWNDGHWWYWLPEGRWVYWSNGCWNNYPGPAPYVSAYPSSTQQPLASAGPFPAGSIYSTSGYPAGTWSSGEAIRPFYGHAPSLFGPYVPPEPNSQIRPFYGHAFSQPYLGTAEGDQIGPFYGHAVRSYGWYTASSRDSSRPFYHLSRVAPAYLPGSRLLRAEFRLFSLASSPYHPILRAGMGLAWLGSANGRHSARRHRLESRLSLAWKNHAV